MQPLRGGGQWRWTRNGRDVGSTRAVYQCTDADEGQVLGVVFNSSGGSEVFETEVLPRAPSICESKIAKCAVGEAARAEYQFSGGTEGVPPCRVRSPTLGCDVRGWRTVVPWHLQAERFGDGLRHAWPATHASTLSCRFAHVEAQRLEMGASGSRIMCTTPPPWTQDPDTVARGQYAPPTNQHQGLVPTPPPPTRTCACSYLSACSYFLRVLI